MEVLKLDELLIRLDRLPDLLKLARVQKGAAINLYPVQETLRQEYRARKQPFMWSMPYRHLYSCPECGEMKTEVLFELEDPGRVDEQGNPVVARFTALALHQARVHQVALPEEVTRFLMDLG